MGGGEGRKKDLSKRIHVHRLITASPVTEDNKLNAVSPKSLSEVSVGLIH